MGVRFYICRHCGNIIGMIHSSGVKVKCCGEDMVELVPNTSDGAKEKHVPVVEVSGDKVTVKVGSVSHPMEAEHYIMLCTGRSTSNPPSHATELL